MRNPFSRPALPPVFRRLKDARRKLSHSTSTPLRDGPCTPFAHSLKPVQSLPFHKKNQAPGQKTKRYRRDLDQIHDDVKDKGKQKLDFDLERKDIEDLPGLAQHGCIPCARYFADEAALTTHLRGKPHKKRLKLLQEEPYTIEESRRAVGLGEDKGEYTKRRTRAAEAAKAAPETTMTSA
ncbi:hypothetical protein OIV83_003572 [Microbotryomycetes sp. JL201]|nr:hypothetical protein OIV83_003572 [Microbotryomycetes sp. JL201]